MQKTYLLLWEMYNIITATATAVISQHYGIKCFTELDKYNLSIHITAFLTVLRSTLNLPSEFNA